jgi:hypothetical protein
MQRIKKIEISYYQEFPEQEELAIFDSVDEFFDAVREILDDLRENANTH